jgi:hypothetical protein
MSGPPAWPAGQSCKLLHGGQSPFCGNWVRSSLLNRPWSADYLRFVQALLEHPDWVAAEAGARAGARPSDRCGACDNCGPTGNGRGFQGSVT